MVENEEIEKEEVTETVQTIPVKKERKPRSDKGKPHNPPVKEQLQVIAKETPKEKPKVNKKDNTYAYAMVAVTLILSAVIVYIFFIKPKMVKGGEEVD